MPAGSVTGVEVQVKFFPLAFFLFLCTPTIEVDGKKHRKYWGTHFFETPPGRHEIRIYFRYLFKPRCGENSIIVTVPAGGVRRVSYNMPPWMFAKGSMKVLA
jgi:hypothetical protein